MSKKGSEFERELCRTLSLWWTDGHRDDVFWRSQNSGGRATTRRQKGKNTSGQYGDIAATDPVSVPLLEYITFEMKRGYPKAIAQAVLDAPEGAVSGLLEGFFEQAETAAKNANTPFWAVIHRRDRRDAILWMPRNPVILQHIKRKIVLMGSSHNDTIIGVRLDDFLSEVTPRCILDLLDKWRKNNPA